MSRWSERVALALAAAAACAPLAHAGTASSPEARDPAGDARIPWACSDITAAWVEADEAGALTLHMQVAQCPAPPTSQREYWGINFDARGETFFVHAGWSSDNRRCEFWHGHLDPNGSQDHVKGICAYEAGAPARVHYPFAADILRLEPGDVIAFTKIHTGFINGRDPTYEMDVAVADRTFAFDPPVGPAVADSATVDGKDVTADVAAPAPAALLLALAALALLLRRR